jgi:hypothetical protein
LWGQSALFRRRRPPAAAQDQHQGDDDRGNDDHARDCYPDDRAPVVHDALRVHVVGAGKLYLPDEGIPLDFVGVVVLYRAGQGNPVIDHEYLAKIRPAIGRRLRTDVTEPRRPWQKTVLIGNPGPG